MKEKLYRFMQGRYGNDQLNRFLMILVIVCLVLSMLGIRPFYIVGILCLVFSYYRMLSKNYRISIFPFPLGILIFCLVPCLFLLQDAL